MRRKQSMFRRMLITVPCLVVMLMLGQFAHAQEGIKAKPMFTELKPALPTQTGDKIEVIEVFWYGCPHCYSFEPFLEEWLKTLPADVQLIRVPGVMGQNWIPLAKAYY